MAVALVFVSSGCSWIDLIKDELDNSDVVEAGQNAVRRQAGNENSAQAGNDNRNELEKVLDQTREDELARSIQMQQERTRDLQMQREIFDLLEDPNGRFSITFWNNSNIDEKKIILTEFLAEVQQIMGTSVKKEIEFFRENSGLRAKYTTQKRLRINEYQFISNFWDKIRLWDFDGDYDYFNVLIHEVRHAYQIEAVYNLSENKHIVSDETLFCWERNFPPNYVEYEIDPQSYFAQPIEWDAFNFSKSYKYLNGITPVYEGSWIK